MKTILLAGSLLGGATLLVLGLHRAPKAPPSLSVNRMRVLAEHHGAHIEHEVRLAVPVSLSADVWSYLLAQQSMHPLEPPSVTQTTDWYYDTADGKLAADWLAVRLRVRESNREVQIKAYDRITGYAAELDFDTGATEPGALLAVIDPDDQPALREALNLFGLAPEELRADRLVYQARHRISLRAITVSLDRLTWAGGEHHVLELKPQSKNADDAMASLARELCAVFPGLRTDRAPKIVAVRQRTSVRDESVCLWPAAAMACRPAAPARASVAVPSFVPPIAPVAPEAQMPPNFITGRISSGSMTYPPSTRIGPRATGRIGTGRYAAPLGTGLP